MIAAASTWRALRALCNSSSKVLYVARSYSSSQSSSEYLMGTVLYPSQVELPSGSSVIKALVSEKDSLVRHPKFKPAGLLIFATPQYAVDMYNTISTESFDYNVFGAIVDVVPPGGRRDGLSYLWTSMPITLDKQHSSVRTPHTNESGTHSDSTHSHSHGGDLEVVQGRFISRGGEQWSLNPQFVSLNFKSKRTIKMQSASTIFETETESMMIAREIGEEAKMFTSMTLNIPHQLKLEPIKAESALEFLPNKSARPGESEDMYVTSSKDNIIRTINNKPASSFLEDSLAAGLFLDPVPPMNTRFTKNLENPKNRSVYALINDTVRYKVIAGGGGWGVRAGMLVLDPEAKVPANAKIEFYVTKNAGPDYGIADAELMTGDQSYGRVYFECVEPIQFLDDAEVEGEGGVVEEVALEGIFGAGTDNRFLVGTKKYDVHGEFVAASIVE